MTFALSAKNAFRAAAATGTAAGLTAACAVHSAADSLLLASSTANPTVIFATALAALYSYVIVATHVNDAIEQRLLRQHPPKP